MYFQLPKGVTSVGVEGKEYKPDENGIVSLPDLSSETIKELGRHGLVLVGAPKLKAPEPPKPLKTDLDIEALKSKMDEEAKKEPEASETKEQPEEKAGSSEVEAKPDGNKSEDLKQKPQKGKLLDKQFSIG